jgi:hypothetical protein
VPLSDDPEFLKIAFAPLLDYAEAFELDGLMMFQLLSALQLACRHPNFHGPTRDFVESYAHFLQRGISKTPTLAAMCEAGWNPAYDVPHESSRTRIIIP